MRDDKTIYLELNEGMLMEVFRMDEIVDMLRDLKFRVAALEMHLHFEEKGKE